jgi:predicted metal-dependent hydrolase
LQDGLFLLAHVKTIESEAGIIPSIPKSEEESPEQRRERLEARKKQLIKQDVTNFNQQIAEEEGISVSRVKQLLSP